MKLIDEIREFLTGNGFECSVQMRGGLDVLCISTLDGHCERMILPLEIAASSYEEAVRQSEAVSGSIGAIISSHEGYPLIVTRDRWNLRREMMEKRILAHLEVFSPIYARNCEIRRIDKAVAREFLERTHSYGHASCRYCYGMFLRRHTGHIAEGRSFAGAQDDNGRGAQGDNRRGAQEDNGRGAQGGDMAPGGKIVPGTLVAVATFSNARKWIKGDRTVRSYEWTRYASLPQARISGGMGRLLKHFIKEVRPDDIMTYADLEWSEGDVYMRLGFTPEGRKDPVMFTIDEDWRRTAVRIGQRIATAPAELRNDIDETHDAMEPTMKTTPDVMAPAMRGIQNANDLTTREAKDFKGLTTKETQDVKGLTTRGTPDVIASGARQSYFRNFGSNKFRLKLTDYE